MSSIWNKTQKHGDIYAYCVLVAYDPDKDPILFYIYILFKKRPEGWFCFAEVARHPPFPRHVLHFKPSFSPGGVPKCPPFGTRLKNMDLYMQLDADNYENDPQLAKIRKENNYNWMDIITIHKDKMPNYEEKIKIFYEEHLHLDDEIRYILEGSGYFDVRDKEDKWIRIAMEKGDMITLPAGIYHRFTLDESNYVKAMRLFVGEPVWTAYNRPADHFPARAQYQKFLAQAVQ